VGAFSICAGCGAFLKYGEGLRLEKTAPEVVVQRLN